MVLGKEARKISVFINAYNHADEVLHSYHDDPIITYWEDDIIFILNEDGTTYDTLAMFDAELGTSWRLSRQACQEDAPGEE